MLWGLVATMPPESLCSSLGAAFRDRAIAQVDQRYNDVEQQLGHCRTLVVKSTSLLVMVVPRATHLLNLRSLDTQ